jgi:hypothetical protein
MVAEKAVHRGVLGIDAYFYIHIDSLYPEDYYLYEKWPEKTEIGKQLGEEEWYITASDTNISNINIQDSNSRYSLPLPGKTSSLIL